MKKLLFIIALSLLPLTTAYGDDWVTEPSDTEKLIDYYNKKAIIDNQQDAIERQNWKDAEYHNHQMQQQLFQEQMDRIRRSAD